MWIVPYQYYQVILYLTSLPVILQKFLLSCVLQVNYKQIIVPLCQTLGELVIAVYECTCHTSYSFWATCNLRAVLVQSQSYFCLLGSLSPPTSKAGQREGGLWSEEGIHTIYFSHPATQTDIPGGCSSGLITSMELLHHSTDAQNTGQGPSCFLDQIKIKKLSWSTADHMWWS